MLPRQNPASLFEWIQEHLGPLLVAFIVFVLPAIKAALAAKKQGAAPKPRDEQAPEAGRQAWKDLLEGRTEAPPRPAPRPPPLPEPEPDIDEEESLEEHPPTPMVALPSASVAEPAPVVQAAEPVAAPAAAVAAAPAVRGAADRWLFPAGPARDRAAALRRAVVLREVLGPPLALR